jgi:hypothetical protein
MRLNMLLLAFCLNLAAIPAAAAPRGKAGYSPPPAGQGSSGTYLYG